MSEKSLFLETIVSLLEHAYGVNYLQSDESDSNTVKVAPPNGWVLIDPSPDSSLAPSFSTEHPEIFDALSTSNFGVSAYKSEETGKIIVAFDGLESVLNVDEVGNIIDVHQGVPADFVAYGVAFTQWIQAENPGSNISLIGHSQGGAIAGLVAVQTGLAAVALNAQGSSSALESLTTDRWYAVNSGHLTQVWSLDGIWYQKDGNGELTGPHGSLRAVGEVGSIEVVHLPALTAEAISLGAEKVYELRIDGDLAGAFDVHIGSVSVIDVIASTGVSAAHGLSFIRALNALGVDWGVDVDSGAVTLVEARVLELNEACNGAIMSCLMDASIFVKPEAFADDGVTTDGWFQNALHESPEMASALLAIWEQIINNFTIATPPDVLRALIAMTFQVANQDLIDGTDNLSSLASNPNSIAVAGEILSLGGGGLDFNKLVQWSLDRVFNAAFAQEIGLPTYLALLAFYNLVLASEVAAGGLTVPTDAAGLTSLRLGDEAGSLLAFGGIEADDIIGSAANDLLLGDIGDDSLRGGDGDDRLYGGDGADVVRGDGGDDRLAGGSGDDDLAGGAGHDALKGGNGEDLISGDDGDDILEGGAGDDTLFGGDGNDVLRGEEGDDYLDGGNGDDELDGGADNDRLYGGAGLDRLTGGGGLDILVGGDGDDFLDGGQGNDFLGGGSGNDTLIGGDGNDVLEGGLGLDDLFGGDGDDLLIFADGDRLFGGLGYDAAKANETVHLTSVDSVEKIEAPEIFFDDSTPRYIHAQTPEVPSGITVQSQKIHAGSGNDRMYGDDGGNLLDGRGGSDRIMGYGGADVLIGGSGNDVLIGGDGSDVLQGDAGNDKIWGGNQRSNDVYKYHLEVWTLDNESTTSFKLRDANGILNYQRVGGKGGHVVLEFTLETDQHPQDYVFGYVTGGRGLFGYSGWVELNGERVDAISGSFRKVDGANVDMHFRAHPYMDADKTADVFKIDSHGGVDVIADFGSNDEIHITDGASYQLKDMGNYTQIYFDPNNYVNLTGIYDPARVAIITE